MPSRRPAFTAIELIVVLGIFVVAIAITLPFLGKFQQEETLGTISQDIVQTLRRAQNSAITGKQGLPWGVHFTEHAYIRFAGASFTERITALDEKHTIPSTFELHGATTMLFAEGMGTMTQDRAVVLSGPEQTAIEVFVNAEGGIFLREP